MSDQDASVDPADSQNPSPTETVILREQPQPLIAALAQDPSQIRVEVVGGPMDGLRKTVLSDTLTIGRGDGNDLPLPLDLMVSARHAQIVREDGGFWLRDLESRNGTFVGEKRLEGRTPLRAGTIFFVGGTCLQFMPS